MSLKYITQLGKTEFIELINFCIEGQNRRGQEKGTFSQEQLVSDVTVYDEIDRRDGDGKRYYFVCSFDGARVLNSYEVRDFSMTISDGGFYGIVTAADYTDDMREFMAKRFGKPYIKSLYQHQVSRAEKEMNRLLDVLPKEKKL